MKIQDLLKDRRSYYAINDKLPVADEQVVELVNTVTELVPDAFNMKSSRVVLALGDNQKKLWDAIYDAFDGKVAREKIDGFKAGAGTVLYFIDQETVENMQAQFAPYAANFPIWSQQSSGMLQISIWSGLRELGIGASVQHYNPVIDAAVKKMFNVPEKWMLVAQMPFGGIAAQPDPKDREDISKRVAVYR